MIPVAVGLFGTLIGSFLNVVVYRIPAGMSVVAPPSACPECGSGIRGYDNIPVVSWFLLRGRCRDCGARISARYPLVELGTAVAFALVAAWMLPFVSTSFTSGKGALAASAGLVLIAYLYFAAICVALTLIDLESHTLPNRIVLPAYIVGGVLFAVAAALTGDGWTLLRAAIGLGGTWLLFATIAFAKPGGMGFGDVKLAGVIGLYLGWAGWGQLVVGVFAAFAIGGVAAGVLLLVRRVNRRSGIPFGPAMLAGAWAGLALGEQLWNLYLHLTGLA